MIPILNLYKFYVDCGRLGSIEGLFAATEDDLIAAYGNQLDFGEVLGKHSDVSVDFGPEDITKIEGVDHSTVCLLCDAFDSQTFSGFNPIAQYESQVADGYYGDNEE